MSQSDTDRLLDLVPEIADMFGVPRSEVRHRIMTRPCPTCSGKGFVINSSIYTWGKLGGGTISNEQCPTCGGIGRVQR